jgi:hypothetical protein
MHKRKQEDEDQGRPAWLCSLSSASVIRLQEGPILLMVPNPHNHLTFIMLKVNFFFF